MASRKKRPPLSRRISTSSLALRIALSGAFRVLIVFIIIDAIVLWIIFSPQISAAGGPEPFFRAMSASMPEFLESELGFRLALLFRVEGIFLLIMIILETVGIKRQLAPIERMGKAADRLTSLEIGSERLESAIESFSPTADGASIYTGDTELEGLENAVNKLVTRMRESYSQQARFVSDASHELRTPIAVIRGYADMLERWGKDDEKVLEESVRAIKSESESMQQLVEQLLFLARGDSGRQPLKMSKFNLSEMLREVCGESAMIDAEHEYRYEGEEKLTAFGDRSMLKETVRILVENAAKYSPSESEIVLKAFHEDGNPAFSVQDSGIGMSQEALAHMFERFYREDDSRSKQTGGSGLGLAIAKWIVDRHGGSFEAVSVKDIGTRVTVRLKKEKIVKALEG